MAAKSPGREGSDPPDSQHPDGCGINGAHCWVCDLARSAASKTSLDAGGRCGAADDGPPIRCGYRWDDADHHFRCPCHGSVYDIAGKVVGEPAPRPLDALSTKVKQGKLCVVYKEFKTGLESRLGNMASSPWIGGPYSRRPRSICSSTETIGEHFDRVYDLASLTSPPFTNVQTSRTEWP